MGARIRALDWEKSPLGPISSWPQSKSTVDLMMASQLAMNLIWGPGRIQIYNDTNRAFLGTKHPNALGRPGREDFSEVWEAAEALHLRVFAGESITLEDHPWTHWPHRRNVSYSAFRPPSAMRRAPWPAIFALLSKPLRR